MIDYMFYISMIWFMIMIIYCAIGLATVNKQMENPKFDKMIKGGALGGVIVFAIMGIIILGMCMFGVS